MTLQEIRDQLRRANLDEVAAQVCINVRTLYRIRDAETAKVLAETHEKLETWANEFRNYKRIPKHLKRRSVGAPKGTVKALVGSSG